MNCLLLLLLDLLETHPKRSLTAGTTTSTAATITSGTVTNLASTTGTIATLNSTTGTIATLNSTTGTIATLNSTTGTITNLSTTLAGDFTISQGTGTLGTSGATAGTYGSVTAIPFLTVNAKGIITSATTGTFSSTPADGSITPAKLSQPFTRATAVTASTSGTAINFTGIPSWVKRITVMLNEVSTNGANSILIQIGDSGGIKDTGYVSTSVTTDSAGGSAGVSRTDGYVILYNSSSLSNSGLVQIANISGNIWIESHSCKISTLNILGGGGSKTLSDTLDRIRVTTVGTTNEFAGGSVNIMYEG